MYKLADGLKLELAKNNYFIICEENQKIIVLKKREAEVLEKVLASDIQSVAVELAEQYDGEGIEKDVFDFCNKLKSLGVLLEI